MPPILGRETFHHSEWVNSQREFHLAYGQAMAQWALIEERLSYWFQDTTGLPYEMARAMFFSPRVFQARTDLLEVAIKHSFRLCECSLRFIKAGTIKAGKYSAFRNQLAHGEQTFDVRIGSQTFKQTILISGKLAPEKAAESAITVDRLTLATERYRELARLLMDATEFVNGGASATHPEECLQQLHELPNQADASKS